MSECVLLKCLIETHDDCLIETHDDCLIESHEECLIKTHEECLIKTHEECLIETHEVMIDRMSWEMSWRMSWRAFNRESWRKSLRKSWRLYHYSWFNCHYLIQLISMTFELQISYSEKNSFFLLIWIFKSETKTKSISVKLHFWLYLSMQFIERVEWTVLHMMKSMQIVERSCRLLYLYTANVTESRHTIFFLTLVYEELLEMSLSSHFSTHCFNSDHHYVDVDDQRLIKSLA